MKNEIKIIHNPPDKSFEEYLNEFKKLNEYDLDFIFHWFLEFLEK